MYVADVENATGLWPQGAPRSNYATVPFGFNFISRVLTAKGFELAFSNAPHFVPQDIP